MLCNARSPLFALLADQGLTLASAREAVRKYHDEHAERSDTAENVDDESARERYEEDREALRGIGIDLDKVREAVRGRFGEDLSAIALRVEGARQESPAGMRQALADVETAPHREMEDFRKYRDALQDGISMSHSVQDESAVRCAVDTLQVRR